MRAGGHLPRPDRRNTVVTRFLLAPHAAAVLVSSAAPGSRVTGSWQAELAQDGTHPYTAHTQSSEQVGCVL
jgi:hypothetical protein